MSALYGQVHGSAETTASRRGSVASHIRSSVQSWNGSIITEMYYHDDDLRIRVEYSDDSCFYGKTIYDGSVSDFVTILSNNRSGLC